MVDWGDSALSGMPINQRDLQIVVPNTTLTDAQPQAINNAIAYGKENGVNVIITVGK